MCVLCVVRCLLCVVLQPSGGAVTLTESVALVSQGTTGLVTWEAGLQLAEWALEHQEPFSGRYAHTPLYPHHVTPRCTGTM